MMSVIVDLEHTDCMNSSIRYFSLFNSNAQSTEIISLMNSSYELLYSILWSDVLRRRIRRWWSCLDAQQCAPPWPRLPPSGTWSPCVMEPAVQLSPTENASQLSSELIHQPRSTILQESRSSRGSNGQEYPWFKKLRRCSWQHWMTWRRRQRSKILRLLTDRYLKTIRKLW